jgi:DNA-binding MarR family transcriptional regulator
MTISPQLELLFALSKASSVITRRFSSQGLSFTDVALLLAITTADDGKMRAIDVAEQLGVTASGITRTLLPLEKIGVVKREANPYDGRSSLVMLTPAGKRLLEDALAHVEEKATDALAGVSDKKLTDATEVLNQLGK